MINRSDRISEFNSNGGVLILSYSIFQVLSNDTDQIPKKYREIFQEGLIKPGPDLAVCDEGHLLKNAKTSMSKAVNRLTTMRRIVLSGTPEHRKSARKYNRDKHEEICTARTLIENKTEDMLYECRVCKKLYSYEQLRKHYRQFIKSTKPRQNRNGHNGVSKQKHELYLFELKANKN